MFVRTNTLTCDQTKTLSQWFKQQLLPGVVAEGVRDMDLKEKYLKQLERPLNSVYKLRSHIVNKLVELDSW